MPWSIVPDAELMQHERRKAQARGGGIPASSLLVLSVGVAVGAAILCILAVQVFQPQPGTTLTRDGRFLLGDLQIVRTIGIAISILFAIGLILSLCGPRSFQIFWPILGTCAAVIELPLLVYFSFGFVDCFQSCNPPAPSHLLWPAFLLYLTLIPLGIVTSIAVGKASQHT